MLYIPSSIFIRNNDIIIQENNAVVLLWLLTLKHTEMSWSFTNFWRRELRYGAPFLIQGGQFTLLYMYTYVCTYVCRISNIIVIFEHLVTYCKLIATTIFYALIVCVCLFLPPLSANILYCCNKIYFIHIFLNVINNKIL